MKRIDLVRHLEAHGCRLLREGGNHSVDVNPANDQTSAVPRHREINDYLARNSAVTWGFRSHETQQEAA